MVASLVGTMRTSCEELGHDGRFILQMIRDQIGHCVDENRVVIGCRRSFDINATITQLKRRHQKQFC